MKVIEKTITWSNRKGQKIRHEIFSDYIEFYNMIMSRQPSASKTLQQQFDYHDTGWMGVDSLEEGVDLFLNGWQKPVEDLKQQFNKELNRISKKEVKRSFSDIAGFVPIVPNAIIGLPNSMINTRRERVKSKILTFAISVSKASRWSAEEIIEKMAKIMAVIASIERSGNYRCKIEVFGAFYSRDREEDKTFCSYSIPVKNENQPFDIKRTAFPIIHPAMLRLLSFGWYTSLPMKTNDYLLEGYGRGVEYWSTQQQEEYKSQVLSANETVFFIDVETDIEKLLKEKGGVNGYA